MKKQFSIFVASLVVILLTVACESKSGKRRQVQTEITAPPKEEKKEAAAPADNAKQSFTPINIEVTMPVEKKNDLMGESQWPADTYKASIIFIDEQQKEYTIDFFSAVPKAGYFDKEQGKKQADQDIVDKKKELAEMKSVFSQVTNSNPSDWRIDYTKESFWLYKISKPTEKKIGNLKVRQEESELIWYGYYSKK